MRKEVGRNDLQEFKHEASQQHSLSLSLTFLFMARALGRRLLVFRLRLDIVIFVFKRRVERVAVFLRVEHVGGRIGASERVKLKVCKCETIKVEKKR